MSAQIKTLSNDYRDINGREVAAQMHARTAEAVASLVAVGWQPRLVSIRVGVDPAVDLYIRNQERAARKVGIEFECRNVSAGISERELRATITSLNTDPRVTGVILQRPVPGGVGPVTVAVLMRNTVIAAERLKAAYSEQLSNQI